MNDVAYRSCTTMNDAGLDDKPISPPSKERIVFAPSNSAAVQTSLSLYTFIIYRSRVKDNNDEERRKMHLFLYKRRKNVSKWPCKKTVLLRALHHQREGYIYAEHAQAGNTLLLCCVSPLLREINKERERSPVM